jgi:DNA invertase Pin-like site-specific DNA recombinase
MDDLLNHGQPQVQVRVRALGCRCGCGRSTDAGRKFLNQEHYDRSKGLSAAAVDEVLTRFADGASAKRLAREYGVAHTTVYRLLSKHQLI